MDDVDATGEGLALFGDLSVILDIELSQPAEPITPKLLNLKAPPDAKIVSVRAKVGVFEDNEIRDITDLELDLVVVHGPTIEIAGLAGGYVQHHAPDGRRFTVRDVIRCIEETERQTRGDSEWFDGVDVHHVFMDSFERCEDGRFRVWWGS